MEGKNPLTFPQFLAREGKSQSALLSSIQVRRNPTQLSSVPYKRGEISLTSPQSHTRERKSQSALFSPIQERGNPTQLFSVPCERENPRQLSSVPYKRGKPTQLSLVFGAIGEILLNFSSSLRERVIRGGWQWQSCYGR